MDDNIHIYLFCGMIHLGKSYEVMGRVRDICLVPNTNTIYVLARMANKCENVRYRLSKVKYDTNETSTKYSAEIASIIANVCKNEMKLYCVKVLGNFSVDL